MIHCPKCGEDISDTFEPDDFECNVQAGWYCSDCDLAVGENEVDREPQEGDVPIITAREFRGDRPLGTPLSEISTKPGTPGYAEWIRICKSYGDD